MTSNPSCSHFFVFLSLSFFFSPPQSSMNRTVGAPAPPPGSAAAERLFRFPIPGIDAAAET